MGASRVSGCPPPVRENPRTLLYQSIHLRVSHSTSRLDFPHFLGSDRVDDLGFEDMKATVAPVRPRKRRNGGHIRPLRYHRRHQLSGIAPVPTERSICASAKRAVYFMQKILRSTVGVMDQALVCGQFPLPDRRFQSIQNELGGHLRGGAPADGRANTSMIEPWERHWSE